jgi:uncharacterized OB-fold protein
MDAKPLADDLFVVEPDGPRLVAGRHRTSGRLAFPLPAGSEGEVFERVLLPREGTLWSWTVQRFLPKAPPYGGAETPETFQPYVVGYVELPGALIVEARIVDVPPEQLRLGLPLTLVLRPFTHRDGSTRTVYAFAPIG